MTAEAFIECDNENIPDEHIGLFTGIAKMAHEVVRSYSEVLREDQLPWFELTKEAQDKIIGRVAFVVLNPDAKPQANHDMWMFKMLSNGWKYAKVIDTVEKKHPSLVPFHHLPTEQQAKDHIFNAVVSQIMNT